MSALPCAPAYGNSSTSMHNPSIPRASPSSPQNNSIQRAPVPDNTSVSYNTLCSLAISDLERWLAEQKATTLDDPSGNSDIDSADHPSRKSSDSKQAKREPSWYHKKRFGYVDDDLHLFHASKLYSKYMRKRLREGFRTNPYGLNARYFVVLWLFLVVSAIGTLVATRWDPHDDLIEGRRRKRVIYANLFKGLFATLPLLTTATVFMFPPLYMPY
ncbi:hypothetical protein P153DRAFT_381121 [Dothidotthia symphoricarpi CBS 119687]|uniref:Uncharacterized protein n=1 Tax=Dothidotthia symphoricarpi CBS 119687 TaxID=1392245 RepID=A0A6A6APV6_9PLEO|nr:uncharacterized protein P153DRAFT_381121 [Dothidotthia symphoricarpi CBS 119687]KAF2133949.1 hypothetical protein P153DRAFT_381121 [Dothidotthia symphoricarpi CBS 119687]